VPRGAFTGVFVEPVELVFSSVAFEIGLSQKSVVIGADEQGKVRLLADEVLVDEALIDDDLAHCQGKRSICPRFDGDVHVGMNRGRVVIGSYGDDLSSVITRLPDEMGRWNAGV
jgi:hypothetical protein